MQSYYRETKNIIEDGFKALLRRIILFGSSLIILGSLIFVFPAVIGFLFAGFILFTGISSLYARYKVWKLRKYAQEYRYEAPFSYRRFERPFYHHARIFII